ncbi:MAG TPA: hypothetical protein VJT08_06495 [Terriglobales bacterium]|nr:hypothetical protein [Terriglobales bacterium]
MKRAGRFTLYAVVLTLCVLMIGSLTSTPSFSQQSNPGRLVGSWKAAVTPISPPGLDPFTDLLTFTSDGSVIETRRLFVPATPFGALLETPGHGGWTRTADGQFDIHFTFLLQGAKDGADVGTDNVHLLVSLDSTGTALSGTFESTVKDPSGNALFTATGTFSANPI